MSTSVNIHPIVKAISKPISDSSSVGNNLDANDEDLDFLETELMKKGTPLQSSINWDKAKQVAIDILANKSKNVKVASNLCSILTRAGDTDGFPVAINAMYEYIDKYLQEGFPDSSNSSNKRVRDFCVNNIFNDLVQGGKNWLTANNKFTDTDIHTINAMPKLVKRLELDNCDDNVNKLVNLTKVKPSDLQNSARSNSKSKSASSGTTSGRIISNSGDRSSLELDSRDEAAFKQDLRSIADKITSINIDDAEGFRLRRYAAYLSLKGLFSANTDEISKIKITPIAGFIANEFSSQINEPTSGLLMRLEDRLFLNPLWMAGHRLSYLFATNMGLQHAALGIRGFISDLVARAPHFLELKFTDDNKLFDEETADWIDNGNNKSTKSHASSALAPWDSVLFEAKKQIQENNVKDALLMLNEGLGGSSKGREYFHWRLAQASLYKDMKMNALAESILEELRNEFNNPTLKDWEPQLAKILNTKR